MTALHRTPAFLRAYRFLPHGLINGLARRVTRARRPRWAIDLAVREWIRREQIDLTDYEPRRYDTLEEFFLRRLREGARPPGEGLVAPADGRIVGAGTIERDTILQVKGVPLSVDRLIHGAMPTAPRQDLGALEGGAYVTTFLSPRGYHFVHAPLACEVVDVRWIGGRWFPQNEDALRHIAGIYERNERAVLRLRIESGNREHEAFLVMVGASVIGGIELAGRARKDWVRPHPVPLGLGVAKGEELGHFTFGSTVVLLLPHDMSPRDLPLLGTDVAMGQSLVTIA